MSSWLPFIFAGLSIGSVYGLASVGLVLTYKTSGIFNFAQGSLATISAFLFYTLQQHVSWPVAAIIATFVAGPLLGVVLERLGRVVLGASLVVQVVATLGVLLIIEAGVILIYGTATTRTVNAYLPQSSFTLGGASVSAQDIILFVLPLLATVGLYVYFRLARTGLAMRAVVDNTDLLDLSGTSPIVIRRWAWVIGSTFACASGVLIAPLLPQIDSSSLTLLVVTAFGAAAIGSFSNLPLTYAGGLVLGLAGSVGTKYLTNGFWSELPSALPFVILFLVLLFARRSRLAEPPVTRIRDTSAWRAPMQLQAGSGICLLVFLMFVPHFAGVHLDDWTSFLTNVLLFLSLGLLARTSGQVSLCQVTFVAIGAETFSHMVVGNHVPWLPALLISGLIVVPIGALLAIPAIRLSGLYLALATLGFGIVVQYMFYGQSFMFGPEDIGSIVPRPKFSWLNLSTDDGYYYLLLFVVVLVSLVVVLLINSRLGRLLKAMSASPRGLATSGASVNVTRVLVFCLSASIAAISGALAGGVDGVVSAVSYNSLLSITYFAVVVIVVGGAPWYAIMAGAAISLVPSYVHSANVTNYLTLLFGIGAVLYVLTPADRQGVPIAVRNFVDRVFGVRSKPVFAPAVTGPSGEATPAYEASGPEGSSTLELVDLTVRFGGLLAVDSVSLEAPTGRITGLIGPNGAGKTTTFNVCSALTSPAQGQVLLDGASIGRRGPAARARMGLGRTFQQTELFNVMTVRQNVALGREGGYANANPLAHLVTRRSQRVRTEVATAEALRACAIEHLADVAVGALSTGQRRLVELARCLAGPFRILLLDEPSAGLDPVETQRFGELLRSVVEGRGIGILLVEHDMSLVTKVCDFIYVLDFGKMIFSGTPNEVISSPLVRAAYLGELAMEEGKDMVQERSVEVTLER